MHRIRKEYRLLNLFIVGLFVILGCNLCAPPGSQQSAEETARVEALIRLSITPTQSVEKTARVKALISLSLTPRQTWTPSQTPTPTPTSTSTPQAAQPQLTVTASVSQTGYSKTSDVIVYTYTVKNTGQVAVNGPFELVDKKADQWKCDPADSLPVGGQLICKGYYRIRENDLCSSVANVAYVKGIFQGKPVTSDPVSVTLYSGRNCNKPDDSGPEQPLPATPCPLTSC